MTKLQFVVAFLFVAFMTVSCGNESEVLDEIQKIKRLRDSNADSALVLLDAMDKAMIACSDETQNRYDLAQLVLRDKARVLPEPTEKMMKVLKYFESNGSMDDMQEVYYYAGSAYLHFDDTPNAFLYFQKSIESAHQANVVDSIMLRNSYSQLFRLYYDVRDYKNAFGVAEKEAEIANRLHVLDACTMIHEASSLTRMGNTSDASDKLEEAFHYLKNDTAVANMDDLATMLYCFSSLNLTKRAEECYHLLKNECEEFAFDEDTYMALAEYFETVGQIDSSAYCYKAIMNDDCGLQYKYEASKKLSLISAALGKTAESNKYGLLFMAICDSLNLCESKNLPAAAYNKYKYNSEKGEVAMLKEENGQYRSLLVLLVAASIIAGMVFLASHILCKNKLLKELLCKTEEIKMLHVKNDELQDGIVVRESVLGDAQLMLEVKLTEMENMKGKLVEYEKELEAAKTKLDDGMRHNKSIMKLLNQKRFEGGAEHVMAKIHNAVRGNYVMKQSDWERFFDAVNEMHPSLNEKLIEHFGTSVSQQQRMLCYLIRIGLTNSDIQKLTDIPKSTVWRWEKKFACVLEGYAIEPMCL